MIQHYLLLHSLFYDYMTLILLFLTIAGATGLFLFGMKLMSESLQKIMGERIRLILSSMASNKFKGLLTGIFITALIQSSSATTVMVVSFVNAGILRLFEAVSVIMGANIGTTITAWLIGFIGFKVNFIVYTLPIIGLSIPFLFSANRKIRNWGEMFLGFALLFIALNFLKSNIPIVNETLVYQYIAKINSWHYGSLIIFLFVGIVFTILLRSSSAVIALTMVFAFNGWLNFENSAAMVLGENIGTTIAAITAAKVANITAKRAAYAHLFFNLFGVLWIVLILPYFLQGVAYIHVLLGGQNPFYNSTEIPIALSVFHTSFNLINAILLIGFTKRITSFVTKKISKGAANENSFKLTHIKIGLLSTPDASIFQARRETVLFAEKVRKMYINVEHIFDQEDAKEFANLKNQIIETEEFSDRLEKEIANFLTKVGEGRLSESSSRSIRALFKMIDDIESIADSCVNILNSIERKRAQKIVFPEQINNNVHLLFSMVRGSLDLMVTMLTHKEEISLSLAKDTENEINNFRDILKSEHLNNLEKGIYKYDAGIIYNDIISQCERIGDFAMNVDESFKNIY